VYATFPPFNVTPLMLAFQTSLGLRPPDTKLGGSNPIRHATSGLTAGIPASLTHLRDREYPEFIMGRVEAEP